MAVKRCSGCARRKKAKVVYKRQGEKCHPGWGCGNSFRLAALDLAHLRGLGMGASRENDGDARNELSNLVLLCRACHQNQEHSWGKFVGLWKRSLVDWLEPTHSNSEEFWAALSNGLKKEADNGV